MVVLVQGSCSAGKGAQGVSRLIVVLLGFMSLSTRAAKSAWNSQEANYAVAHVVWVNSYIHGILVSEYARCNSLCGVSRYGCFEFFCPNYRK
jgi:hypothetical protein